ncbi:MAG: putative bifunctional diguanylate cyclase/phosphodiesterase [Acidimicrobiales bacterium]
MQITAAVLSLGLNVLTGRRLAWLAISLALSLMAVRRAISMWGHVSGSAERALNPTAELVALAISSLMLLGVIFIGPIFRSIISDREIHRQRRLVDDLTGIANRAGLEEQLDLAVADAAANNSLLGVVFIDIDRFKVVNDSLGHSQGDLVLQVVSKRVQRACRDSDFVARWGGDEFVVVLRDLSGREEAEALCDQLRRSLSGPVALDGRNVSVTVSLGIAFGRGHDDRQAMLRDADLAMYRAKSAGPSQRVVFESTMRDNLVAQLKLERELGEALDNGEFCLHYQPIFEGEAMRVHGVEALIRWDHPDAGVLLPGAFLPVAEASGLMPAIDDWVLGEALRQIAEWSDRGDELSSIRVMVNSSPTNFGDAGYPQRVRAALQATGVSADRLVLELLETVVLDQPSTTHAVIAELRDFGISVFLDDFGTGYSSLSYLTELQVDGIKIDRSFVSGAATDPHRRAIITSIIAMADAMMIPVVAEGIELDADLAVLREAGADFFQGFGLCKPRPAGELGTRFVRQ